ncbi:proline-rich protein [Trifolium pratense]|uniref:Proline-rich protein n=1 Tax=Trifolium pratense TaxID=57577 RepID=A0A2K3MY77_TRIPR|nr:proline-rich protein [Trifolium pratense]
MGSNSAASITILILSLSIFFFTTLSSAQAPTVSPSSPPSPPLPPPPPPQICPNLRICASLLNDFARVVVGSPQSEPCCSLIAGLADVDAVVCLCAAVRANVGGININIPVKEILRVCERNAPNLAACA